MQQRGGGESVYVGLLTISSKLLLNGEFFSLLFFFFLISPQLSSIYFHCMSHLSSFLTSSPIFMLCVLNNYSYERVAITALMTYSWVTQFFFFTKERSHNCLKFFIALVTSFAGNHSFDRSRTTISHRRQYQLGYPRS